MLVDGNAADVGEFQVEPVTKGAANSLQDLHALGGDFGADAVAGQHGDFELQDDYSTRATASRALQGTTGVTGKWYRVCPSIYMVIGLPVARG